MALEKLYQIGGRGVNVTDKPQDLDYTELQQAQNAEIVPDGGQGALDKRVGMTRINSTALADQILLARNISADFDADFEERLYVSIYDGSDQTHSWRYTTDGTTWAEDTTPTGSARYENETFPPVAVTHNRKMYYFGRNAPILVHEYDGTTETALSSVPASVVGTTMGTPQAPIVTYTGELNPLPTPSVPTSTGQTGLTMPIATPTAPTLSGTTGGGDTYNCYYKIQNVSGSFRSAASAEAFKQVSTPQVTITSNETTYDRKVYRTQLDPDDGTTQAAPNIGYIGTIPAGQTTLIDYPYSTAGDGTTPGSASSGVTYTYKIVGVGAHGALSAASSAISFTNRPSPLSASNTNYFDLPQSLCTGATSFRVYKTAPSTGPHTAGLVTTVAVGGRFTDDGDNGNGASAPSAAVPSSGTTYGYEVVAVAADGSYSAGSDGTTYTTAYSSLSASDYTTITIQSPPVSGAVRYDVYRVSGGATQGKIGSINIEAGALSLNDTGLAGDSASVPGSASGTSSSDPLRVYDVISDGTKLIVAVKDSNTPVGRILTFEPSTRAWSQIGETFPTSSGDGTASALLMMGGTLIFGTYAPETDLGYVYSTQQPLPSGGVQTVQTLTTDLFVTDMAVYNGKLYVSTHSTDTADLIAALVREMDTDLTWSTVLTAPATTDNNRFMCLHVFDGKLFVAYTDKYLSGTDFFIKASEDPGTSWTEEVTESTFSTTPYRVSMITFQGNLYAITQDAIWKRTPGPLGTTWTEVDDVTDVEYGCAARLFKRTS